VRQVDHLLIGGGIAGASCALELREQGAKGSIVLVGRELDPPYHRPPCTKDYLRGEIERDAAHIAPKDKWADSGVELLPRTSVNGLDLDKRVATLSTKEEVSFGSALIATGAMVRRLNVDGSDLERIHYIRALGNSDAIRRDLQEGMHVLLVGGSYIGCEVAVSLTMLGYKCTILMLERLPMERGFGATAGAFVRDLLTGHGIELVGEDELARFEGDNGAVARAVTAGGRTLQADLAVLGVGAMPDVMLARRAGLEIGETGGIVADRRLETPTRGVFVAGDCAEFDSVIHGRRARIEHEEVARTQGEHVARAMLGATDPYAEPPYFWCDLGDWATLEYVGLGGRADEERVDGDPASGSFAVRFLRDGHLDGVVAVNRGDALDEAREELAARVRSAG
jgi:3-phenylpropionate/trans-cinnamate dioxygenase ferredoxin reductase subunit